MLSLEQVQIYRGGNPIIKQVDAQIHDGQRVALVGANGCGKSSLLAAITGQISIDQGSISFPSAWRLQNIEQEITALEESALDYVLSGDNMLWQLRQQWDESGHHDAQILAQLEQVGHYDAESRAERVLSGLGFSTEDFKRLVHEFSGGWRMRLALARALFCPSDLLILDEPTNHLDLDAIEWLESWLQNYRGTLLFVAHDRTFLDNVATHILAFEHHEVSHHKGGYSDYERRRAMQIEQQSAAWKKAEAQRAHLESFIRRFGAKASKAAQARSRVKALQRLVDVAPAHSDSQFEFSFPCYEQWSDPLIQLNQVAIGYDQQPLLSLQRFDVRPGDRVALIGRNGAGKSTLMRCLAGDLPALSGERIVGKHCRIAYFTQHQFEHLLQYSSPMAAITAVELDGLSQPTEQAMRNYLGGWGFAGDRADLAIDSLSGGQRTRLALALLAWRKPNVLLLDEPTNHLDLEMRHALMLALQDFEGAVVIISHDRSLLEATIDQRWLVDNGQITDADESAPTSDLSNDVVKAVDTRKLRRQNEAEKRKILAPLKKACQALEKQLDQVNDSLEDIATRLAVPELYQDASLKNELNDLLLQQATLKQQQAEIEAEWMEKEEALEALIQSLEIET